MDDGKGHGVFSSEDDEPCYWVYKYDFVECKRSWCMFCRRTCGQASRNVGRWWRIQRGIGRVFFACVQIYEHRMWQWRDCGLYKSDAEFLHRSGMLEIGTWVPLFVHEVETSKYYALSHKNIIYYLILIH